MILPFETPSSAALGAILTLVLGPLTAFVAVRLFEIGEEAEETNNEDS